MTFRFPTLATAEVPVVDRALMTEVDRVMEQDLGIQLIQMMENAGRCLARLAATSAPAGAQILAFAGRGGNGGGVLTAARRLAGWGYPVTVTLAAPPDSYAGVPGQQLAILKAMNVTITDSLPDSPDGFHVLLDGLVGYSLNGALRGASAAAADLINQRQAAACIALDVPSGFDAAVGRPASRSVRPDTILTIAALKRGLADTYPAVPLYLADIAVPAMVFERLGLGSFAPPADITRLI